MGSLEGRRDEATYRVCPLWSRSSMGSASHIKQWRTTILRRPPSPACACSGGQGCRGRFGISHRPASSQWFPTQEWNRSNCSVCNYVRLKCESTLLASTVTDLSAPGTLPGWSSPRCRPANRAGEDELGPLTALAGLGAIVRGRRRGKSKGLGRSSVGGGEGGWLLGVARGVRSASIPITSSCSAVCDVVRFGVVEVLEVRAAVVAACGGADGAALV